MRNVYFRYIRLEQNNDIKLLFLSNNNHMFAPNLPKNATQPIENKLANKF